MPEKSSNISSSIFYISIGAECLKIARACNNQSSLLDFISSLVRRFISQGTNQCRIANVLLKFFSKHQSDFNYFTEELLAII